MAETLEIRAKLFMNGRSQAVRLPKQFRFEGKEVRIRRHGNGVLLESVGSQLGADDLRRVRRAMKTLGSADPEFGASVDVTLQRLDVEGKSK